MKKVPVLTVMMLFLAVLIFLTGCGITGRVVEEVEDRQTQEDKDFSSLGTALAEKDVSACYSIETQPVREQCFILLAKEMKDDSICRNLLGSLRDKCERNVNR